MLFVITLTHIFLNLSSLGFFLGGDLLQSFLIGFMFLLECLNSLLQVRDIIIGNVWYCFLMVLLLFILSLLFLLLFSFFLYLLLGLTTFFLKLFFGFRSFLELFVSLSKFGLSFFSLFLCIDWGFIFIFGLLKCSLCFLKSFICCLCLLIGFICKNLGLFSITWGRWWVKLSKVLFGCRCMTRCCFWNVELWCIRLFLNSGSVLLSGYGHDSLHVH